MSISYPLTFPTTRSPASVMFRAISTTSIAESTFSGAQVAHSYNRQLWAIDVVLPPMNRSDAEVWIAFLLSLSGRYGTFTYGPTGKTGQLLGNAAYGGLINGASQTGQTVTTDGWASNTADLLKAGDYIEFSSRLYKVLSNVDSDASGNASIDVWPSIREVSDNEDIIISSPSTTFRLTSDQIEYSIDLAMKYGIKFSATEAL